MTTGERPVKCTVQDCSSDAVVTSPLPLCVVDALRVAAAAEQALEAEARMSRVQALTAIKTDPVSTDSELADRTGWPVQWVRSHRQC